MITTKELADELGTDARTTRRFLRKIVPEQSHPKGNRWVISDTDLLNLKLLFVVQEVGIETSIEALTRLREAH